MSDITDKYAQDIVARIDGRRLPQFVRGEVRCEILNEQARQMQELYDAIVSALDQRTLPNARGYVLDVLGRIVGQPRILIDQDELNWFGPDDENWGPNLAPVWIEGVPTAGRLPADDGEYLQLILSKIFKNHVKHSSIPEILEFIRLIYDINISIRKLGLSQIQLIVPTGTPANVLQSIISVLSDERADNQYFLPQCPTADIVSVMHRPQNPFAPDRERGAPDIGEAAVASIL